MIVRDFDADEDPEDWEYPDDEDDDDETMSCPHCRASIYDDAERCPKCGSYLSREDAGVSPGGFFLVSSLAWGW
jgi:uncharacterized paraquat-inducible protein A